MRHSAPTENYEVSDPFDFNDLDNDRVARILKAVGDICLIGTAAAVLFGFWVAGRLLGTW